MVKLKVNGLQIQYVYFVESSDKYLAKVQSDKVTGNLNVSVENANGIVEIDIENLSENIRNHFDKLLKDIELEINGDDKQ